MNEDRFIIISTNEFEGRIYDKFDNEYLNLEQILDLLNDYEKNIIILTMMDLPEMEIMLIKQSSIIRKDEIAIKTMMSNMEKLEEENEKLKNDFYFLKEIHQEGNKSCEKWKQYKEAQIQQLEKENEQLRKDKEILKERLRESNMRLDRFNCR